MGAMIGYFGQQAENIITFQSILDSSPSTVISFNFVWPFTESTANRCSKIYTLHSFRNQCRVLLKYLVKEEIKNSGKPSEMVEKISKGKISKFLNDNSLLNQIWIMDPKKKVSDILKENKKIKKLKLLIL